MSNDSRLRNAGSSALCTTTISKRLPSSLISPFWSHCHRNSNSATHSSIGISPVWGSIVVGSIVELDQLTSGLTRAASFPSDAEAERQVQAALVTLRARGRVAGAALRRDPGQPGPQEASPAGRPELAQGATEPGHQGSHPALASVPAVRQLSEGGCWRWRNALTP
jgi:hypothetical protein